MPLEMSSTVASGDDEMVASSDEPPLPLPLALLPLPLLRLCSEADLTSWPTLGLLLCVFCVALSVRVRLLLGDVDVDLLSKR